MPNEKCILDPQRDCLGLAKAQMLEWQETQQKKPQAFVDDIKGKIIWAVLAAIITFILARIGL